MVSCPRAWCTHQVLSMWQVNRFFWADWHSTVEACGGPTWGSSCHQSNFQGLCISLALTPSDRASRPLLALCFHPFVPWALRATQGLGSHVWQQLPTLVLGSSQEPSPENPVPGPAENSEIGFDHINMQPSRAHLGRNKRFIWKSWWNLFSMKSNLLNQNQFCFSKFLGI